MRIFWILLQGLPGDIDLLSYLECNEWTDDRTMTLGAPSRAILQLVVAA